MTKRPSESAMAAARPVVYQISDYAPDEPEHEREVMQVARAIDKAVEPYDKLLTAVLSQLAFDGEVHADTRAAIGALIAPARGAQGGTDE